ncbi:MAG: chaperonin GroEL [Clostridia bacterium]|nr:chaperonin GroEL [Clostridia bacterium]
MPKAIIFGRESREALKKGVETLSSSVKITLGPRGRNAVLAKPYSSPLITNDGVTIAKEIELKNPFENVGANLVKEVSIKTNDTAGDGTTTAVVLAESIFADGLEAINQGASPVFLKSGIEKATSEIIKNIKAMSKPINSKEEIKQVATISSASQEVGELIAEAVSIIGEDGVITTSESNTEKTELSVVEGMQIDRGYISPYMNENGDQQIILQSPKILITDKKLTTASDVLPIMEKVASSSSPLLIIAEDVEGEALATIILNKVRGIFNCVAIKAPSFGQKRLSIMSDIAVLTGAKFISKDYGEDIKNISIEKLGSAKTVKISKDSTTIIDGAGNADEIEARKTQIRSQIAENPDDFDKTTLEERLSKLGKGVAVIKVGAFSEVELKEKKLRIEDALSATKSAREMGIIIGGGSALLKIQSQLKEFPATLSNDEKLGAQIVINALSAPIKQICANAGVSAEEVIKTISENKNRNHGFDAKNLSYCDMFESGIIDPAYVTISALSNASSVCATMLTTEVVITDEQKSD